MIALLFILREKCETRTLRNKMASLKSILLFLHRRGKSEKKQEGRKYVNLPVVL